MPRRKLPRPVPNDLDALPRVPFPLDDCSDRVAVVSCGKSKVYPTPKPIPAEELYTSSYFRQVLAVCKARYSHVFILSARHGLLCLDTPVKFYDRKLPMSDRDPFARDMIAAFQERCHTAPDYLTIGRRIDLHAGANYARWFTTHNAKAEIRWADWGPIGERRHKYKELR